MQGIIIMIDELPTLAGLGPDKFLIFPMTLLGLAVEQGRCNIEVKG